MTSQAYLAQMWAERRAEQDRLAEYIRQRHEVYGNGRLGTSEAQERAEELDYLIEYSVLLIAEAGERICDEVKRAQGLRFGPSAIPGGSAPVLEP